MGFPRSCRWHGTARNGPWRKPVPAVPAWTLRSTDVSTREAEVKRREQTTACITSMASGIFRHDRDGILPSFDLNQSELWAFVRMRQLSLRLAQRSPV